MSITVLWGTESVCFYNKKFHADFLFHLFVQEMSNLTV